MRNKTKANRVIDITLSEEKAYFPGETIAGSILVHPKSQIKVKPITVKFTGEITLNFKEKEIIQLFQLQKVIQINDGKSKLLEPKLYTYPFKFIVPGKLPSALELKKNNIRVQYRLSAVLDRPMMLETLCPKIEYPLTILELIDVTEPTFSNPQEELKDGVTLSHGMCSVKLSTDRKGYTRGETIPVKIVVNTPKDFVKKDSLQVDLIRKIKLHTTRNTLELDEVLKSNKFDLNIIGPYNFSQSITSQFLLRATPPTAHYKKSLSVHYLIKARLLADKNTAICTVQLPITVGTWPRADIPIDDDEDEDIINQMGEMMMNGDEEEGENEEDLDKHIYRDSIDSRSYVHSPKFTTPTTPTSTFSYTSNNNNNYITTTNTTSTNNMNNRNNNNNNNNNTTTINVKRTNSIESHTSNRSRGSANSFRSSVSSDPRHSTIIQDHQLHRNTLPVNPYPNGYHLNRSTSTPDLQQQQQQQQQQHQQQYQQLQQQQQQPTHTMPHSSTISHNRSQSYYSLSQQTQQYYYPQQQQPLQPQQQYNNYRYSTSLEPYPSTTTSTSYTMYSEGQQQQQQQQQQPSQRQQPYYQQHSRVGSYDMRYFNSANVNSMPTPPLEPAIPDRTLTLLPQPNNGLNTPPVDTVNNVKSTIYDLENEEDDDDLDDDSDDDLLAIIERKKKKEAREMRKKQQQQQQMIYQ